MTFYEAREATAVLDPETEERLQLFIESDLRGKVIRRDLGLEEVGVIQGAWAQVLGSSSQRDLLKAADTLNELGRSSGLSQDQQRLIVAAKEKLREFVRDIIQREDLEASVAAKFRGSSRATLRLGLCEDAESQGFKVVANGGALFQDSSRTVSPWNGDRAQALYCEDGSAALCVTSAYDSGRRQDLECAEIMTRQIVESLRAFVSAEDLNAAGVIEILAGVSVPASISNQSGKASCLFAKTFVTDQPDRIRIKVAQLGYIGLLYRHRPTGELTPLTRVGRAGVHERVHEGFGQWDPTLASFSPGSSPSAFELRLHFGEASLPLDGDLIVLTDGHLDNTRSLSALETIFRCPVFDQAFEGLSPWHSLPGSWALMLFNRRQGFSLDNPRSVTPEQAVKRLQHYHRLVVQGLKIQSESVRRLVQKKEKLLEYWRQLLADEELTPRQLDDLKRGSVARTSRGELLDGRKFGEIQNDLDAHLEYVDASPCRLDDNLALIMPVSNISTPHKVGELGRIISKWFS